MERYWHDDSSRESIRLTAEGFVSCLYGFAGWRLMVLEVPASATAVECTQFPLLVDERNYDTVSKQF